MKSCEVARVAFECMACKSLFDLDESNELTDEVAISRHLVLSSVLSSLYSALKARQSLTLMRKRRSEFWSAAAWRRFVTAESQTQLGVSRSAVTKRRQAAALHVLLVPQTLDRIEA